MISKIWPIMVGALSGSMAFAALAAILGPLMRLFQYPDWYAGTLLSVAGAFWMFASSYWGRASNRFGRKPILMTGLAGEALALLLLAGVVDFALGHDRVSAWTLPSLFALRALLSVFYAAVPVASNAWVADQTTNQNRSGVMAMVGAAQGVGMILGPAIASVTSQSQLSTAFWLAGAMPLLGLIALALAPQRSTHSTTELRLKRLSPKDGRIRVALISAFVCMLTIVLAQLTVGFLAMDKLVLDAQRAAAIAGKTLACVGIALMCAQIVVAKLQWQPERLVAIGAPLAAAGAGITPLLLNLYPSTILMYAGFALAAVGLGFLMPAVQAGGANAVSPEEVSEAAGFVSAAMGAATVVGPIFIAGLYTLHSDLPFLLTGALLLVLPSVWRRSQSTDLHPRES